MKTDSNFFVVKYNDKTHRFEQCTYRSDYKTIKELLENFQNRDPDGCYEIHVSLGNKDIETIEEAN